MEGRLLGYDDTEGSKGYVVLIPDLKKVVVSADVTFMNEGTSRSGLLPDVQDLQFSDTDSCPELVTAEDTSSGDTDSDSSSEQSDLSLMTRSATAAGRD